MYGIFFNCSWSAAESLSLYCNATLALFKTPALNAWHREEKGHAAGGADSHSHVICWRLLLHQPWFIHSHWCLRSHTCAVVSFSYANGESVLSCACIVYDILTCHNEKLLQYSSSYHIFWSFPWMRWWNDFSLLCVETKTHVCRYEVHSNSSGNRAVEVKSHTSFICTLQGRLLTHFQTAVREAAHYCSLPGSPPAPALAPLRFPFGSRARAANKHQCLLQTGPTFVGGIIAGHDSWISGSFQLSSHFLGLEVRPGPWVCVSLLSTFTRLCAMISSPRVRLSVQRPAVMSRVNQRRKYSRKEPLCV